MADNYLGHLLGKAAAIKRTIMQLNPTLHRPATAVRRDNPRLTTRREGGHQPARIVMSRTLDLPEVGWGGAGWTEV